MFSKTKSALSELAARLEKRAKVFGVVAVDSVIPAVLEDTQAALNVVGKYQGKLDAKFAEKSQAAMDAFRETTDDIRGGLSGVITGPDLKALSEKVGAAAELLSDEKPQATAQPVKAAD